jgi:protoheme IX farnesyltransferase
LFKTYYQLTKPGIIYGNLLTATAGFLLASKWHIAVVLFIATLAGMSLVIASACVYNNYIDRDIDKSMSRTKKRALVSGLVSSRQALIYASLLGVIGFAVLIDWTNWWVVGVGIGAFVDYVVLYGISKRRSVHGTIVGSISGAAPVVAGYVAVTDHFSGALIILFMILVLWQMPHFYAIAMYRLDDYKAAKIPVLPAVKGMRNTKLQIMLYIGAFAVAVLALTFFGYAGYVYAVVMLLASLSWLWLGIAGFKANDDKLWARKMFLRSLIIITVFSVMLSVGTVLA